MALNMNMQLDIAAVPAIVGTEPSKLFKRALKVLNSTRWPLYITGPSGSGKSIIAMNLARAYSKKHKVPAYYVQLSPEQTKTSLILGLRLVNGTLQAVDGVVAEAMRNGGIVIIDETTHATQELLLMLNSILDRTAITSIGDVTIIAKDTFRVVFCANTSRYSGNVKLPQSFAQRQVAFFCDWPSFDDEVEITKTIAESECDEEITVPDCVIKYLVALMRRTRKDNYPLSVRNSSIAVVLLELAEKKKIRTEDKYFSEGQNAESVRRTILGLIRNSDKAASSKPTVRGTADLKDAELVDFCMYVSKIGIQEFKQIVLESFMALLDVDMGFYDLQKVQEELKTSII